MVEKKKRPKTAIVAFAQELLEGTGSKSHINKRVNVVSSDIAIEPAPVKKSPIVSSDETQLFQLPSGKKSRFIPKTVDARCCRAWKGNARFQDSMNAEELETLKSSIRAQGQLVPVLARPVKDPKLRPLTHEVIYGSRRLRACQELGVKIKLLEADLSDSDALFFMDAENAAREDLSLYEKAKSYQKWLDDSIFDSKEELANAFGMSKRWVNKILTILNIPDFVIKDVPNLKDLTKLRAETLLTFFDKHPGAEHKVVLAIRKLKQSKAEYSMDEYVSAIVNSCNKVDTGTSESRAFSLVDKKPIVSVDGEEIVSIVTTRSGKVKLELNSKLPPKRLAKFLGDLEKIAKKA